MTNAQLKAAMGTATLDLLSRMPYFRGKGRIALLILRLCKSVLPLTMRLPIGSRVWLSDDDAGRLLLPYCIRKYEREVYTTFKQCLSRLPPDACFIDVGANVGFYSVSAAEYFRKAGPGSVHSFEPNPRALSALRRNSELNRFTNLNVNHQGISNLTGSLTLYISPHAITCGSLQPVGAYLTQRIEVPVTTLDDYASQRRGLKPGLIKIDIEGGELPALQGARRILERDRPYIIYEEFRGFCQAFGYTIRDIRSYLQTLRYNLFVIRPRWPRGARLIPTSYQDADQYPDTQNILAMPTTNRWSVDEAIE